MAAGAKRLADVELMGARGPAPKRSDQRRRENAPARPIDKPGAGSVVVPEPSTAWHPVAAQWYESLARSGQSVFYEQSDWATAYLIAESLSRDFKPRYVAMSEETGEPIYAELPLSGTALSAYLRAFTSLLVTEADRRRSSIELQRGPVVEAEEVSSLDDYRRSLGAG